MSIRVMSLVWDAELPSGEKFTLLALADRADEDGRCWPSVATLARKTGAGPRTIQGHLSSLEEKGVLSVDRRAGTSSIYTISSDALSALDPRRSRTPADLAPPQDLRTHPRRSRTTTPAGSAPNTSVDTSVDSPTHARGSDTSAARFKSEVVPGLGFKDFYAAYPKRVNRRAAEAKWATLAKTKDFDPVTVVAAAHRYARAVAGTERRYIKGPEVWLNKGCWMDEDMPIAQHKPHHADPSRGIYWEQ